MITNVEYLRFLARGGMAAAVIALNEVPLRREIIVEIDTPKLKIGDGVTAYNDLPDLIGGGGSGAMELVGTATVTGSAATTLSMSGLDLATDGRYELSFAFENATGSAVDLSGYYSGDTTATNYYRQSFTVSGTGTGQTRANNGVIMGMPPSETVTGRAMLVLDRDGKARMIQFNNQNIVSTIELQIFAQARDVAGNVTSLAITASVANSLAVNSFFKVWKIT